MMKYELKKKLELAKSCGQSKLGTSTFMLFKACLQIHLANSEKKLEKYAFLRTIFGKL